MDESSTKEMLMDFRVECDTKTFAKAKLAIDRLISEVKNTGYTLHLDSLISGLAAKGGTPTKCVNIHRPVQSDGKFDHPFFEYPHVIYAKLWRWPYTRKEELKHRENCQFGFDLCKDYICVNPYHYDRVISVPNFKSTPTDDVNNRVETIAKSESSPLEKSAIARASSSNTSTDVILDPCICSGDFYVLATSSGANPGQDLAKTPNIVELSNLSSEAEEMKLNALLSEMSSEGGSEKYDTSGCSNRKSNTSTSSSSSDDGFEIINYYMDIEELVDDVPSEDETTSCPTVKDEAVEKELGTGGIIEPEVVIKSDHTPEEATESLFSTPAQNASEEFLVNNFTDESIHNFKALSINKLTSPELSENNEMDAAGDYEPSENSQLPVLENNIKKEPIKIETDKDKEPSHFGIENVVRWEKSDGDLKQKYEQLKAAFVEVGFAATEPSTEKRCKEVLKAMNDVDDEFRDESTSSKQYAFLKTFINSGSCAIMSGTSVTAGSSSNNTPYSRKVKPNLASSIRKKTNPSPVVFTDPVNGLAVASGSSNNSLVWDPATGWKLQPRPSGSLNYSFGWDPREPIPTVTIEHRPASGPSQVQEEPKVTEAINQGLQNKYDGVGDSADKTELMNEILALRNKVRSLETQMQVQKQDEAEKMAIYTNSLRDQYIKTVSRLNELNKVLSDKIAEKDSQIALLNRTFDGLEIQSLLDEKDREIDALNDNLLALSVILTKNEEEIQSLKNEKRKLKRNSDVEEVAEEISSKRRPDSQAGSESNKVSTAVQKIFDSICTKLENSNLEKPESGKVSPALQQVFDSVDTKSENSNLKKSQESIPLNTVENKEDTAVNDVPIEDDSSASSESQKIDALTSSFDLFQIKEKEQALIAKLTEITAEMEVLKITNDKTKSELEARLKNGAKQYAKLYMKYDKMVRNSQTKD